MRFVVYKAQILSFINQIFAISEFINILHSLNSRENLL